MADAKKKVEFKFLADASKFLAETKKVASAVKETAEKLKGVANAAALTGAAFVALGTKMVSSASEYDSKVASATSRLKASYAGLSVTIGRMLVPVVDSLSVAIQKVSGFFAGLSPETQKQILDWALFAAKVTAGVFALSKAVGVVGGVAQAVAGLAGMIGPILPLLPVIAGIATAVVAVISVLLLLHKAWRENWGGMQEKTSTFLDGLKSSFVTAFEFVLKVIYSIKKPIADVFSGVLGMVKRTLASLGMDVSAVTDTLSDLAQWEANLFTPEGIKNLIGDTEDTAKKVGTNIKDGIVSGLEVLGAEAKIVLKQLGVDVDALIEKFRGLGGVRGPVVTQTLDERADQRAEMSSVNSKIHKSVLDAFKEQDKRDREAQKQAAAARAQAKEGVVGSFVGATGKVGQVAGAAAQGAAMGGAGGALVAVVADLVSGSKTFARIIEVATEIIDTVADALGGLLQPVLEVLHVVSGVLGPVLYALKPVFDTAGKYLMAVVPLVRLFGIALEAIAPALGAIAQLAMGPLALFVEAALMTTRAMFEVFRFVGKTFVQFGRVVQGVWNTILDGIAGLMRWIGGFDIAGFKPFGFLNDWANSVSAAKLSTGTLDRTMAALNGLTWDQAMAVTASTDATKEATAAAKEFGEELLNAPSGFKIQQYRFNAANQFDPADMMEGSSSRASALGPKIVDNSVVNITVNPSGDKTLAQQIADEVLWEQEKRQQRQTGTLSATAPSRVRSGKVYGSDKY